MAWYSFNFIRETELVIKPVVNCKTEHFHLDSVVEKVDGDGVM